MFVCVPLTVCVCGCLYEVRVLTSACDRAVFLCPPVLPLMVMCIQNNKEVRIPVTQGIAGHVATTGQ